MAETEKHNTKIKQSVPSSPTERKTILSDDASDKIGTKKVITRHENSIIVGTVDHFSRNVSFMTSDI